MRKKQFKLTKDLLISTGFLEYKTIKAGVIFEYSSHGFYKADTIDMFVHKNMIEQLPDWFVEADPDLENAIEVLCDRLSEDKSEGSYYFGWQSAIAMSIYDEFSQWYKEQFGMYLSDSDVSDEDKDEVHEIANRSAKRFLDMFIHVSGVKD